MLIVKVIKPLVSTNRIPDFEHKHLQVVQDGSAKKVAVDAVGAKPGDWVICVSSSPPVKRLAASRIPVTSPSWASSITGNRTHRRPQLPHRLQPCADNQTSWRCGRLMEIMQVMGTLVCSYRVAGLDHMHLRILKNNKGKKLVAVTPLVPGRATGCSPPAAPPPACLS